jgi:hypothetical protein
MTMQVKWHLQLVMESSAVDRAKELAKSDRRTVSNYVASLIEQAQRPAPPRPE